MQRHKGRDAKTLKQRHKDRRKNTLFDFCTWQPILTGLLSFLSFFERARLRLASSHLLWTRRDVAMSLQLVLRMWFFLNSSFERSKPSPLNFFNSPNLLHCLPACVIRKWAYGVKCFSWKPRIPDLSQSRNAFPQLAAEISISAASVFFALPTE